MSYKGILGMNSRNLNYIRPYNPKKRVQLVDNKLETKNLLKKHDLPTPSYYGVIKNIREFETFDFNKLPRNFVIKPNRGFGGGGILVLKSKDKKEVFKKKELKEKEWVDNGGEIFSFKDFRAHILDILDGKFSLSSLPDTALIERKIIPDKEFLKICNVGVPDIRVIVFNKVPVMAMLRLPTIRSRGRANLAAGAVGLGIDIGNGTTSSAVLKMPRRQIVETHPDTNKELISLQVPGWQRILEIAVEAQNITKLGFLGVDIVIDRKFGPQILELNARPGLEIQLANLEGLAYRLERVKGLKIASLSKGIRVGEELFGGDIERRVEDVSGKEVVGLSEEIEILDRKGDRKTKVLAKIDTGADSTSISKELARKLGFKNVLKLIDEYALDEELDKKLTSKEELRIKKEVMVKEPDIEELHVVKSSHGLTLRPYVYIVYYLSGEKKKSLVNITNRKEMKYSMIIGKKDLKNFLVDPSKKSVQPKPKKNGTK
ncbi:RimK/LysX family protein [Patescibacteria group bacterium]|nr:RimK/LysX family protein [Patescibacteria group bacterium]